MSSEWAIRVRHLSKTYRLYDRSRDRGKQWILPVVQKCLGREPAQYYREVHAIENVSFEVKKGETLGIIGRNGSGKSTLLQLIVGTLSPTSGTVEVNGRVAALLELGAGFHPDFTGLENVFLNASLLGLSKADIDGQLDDILAFADIGASIDQPVRTYSSGMFVRLAVAVAVHAAPDVLIVDEALSVGDFEFRNKCMERILALRAQGVTILFVSHDLSTLQIFCDRAIWLDSGRLISIGNPVAICQEYCVSATKVNGSPPLSQDIQGNIVAQQESRAAKFVEVGLDGYCVNEKPIYYPNQDIGFKFTLSAVQSLEAVVFAVSIYRADGDLVIGQTSYEENVWWPTVPSGGIHTGRFILTPNCLAPGDYRVAFGAYSKDLCVCYALTELTVSFSVRSKFPTWGKVVLPCRWFHGELSTNNNEI